VNRRSVPWARAFISAASARSKFQASACRQLASPKIKLKKETFEKSEETCGFLDFFTFQKYLGTAIKTINNW